MDYVDSIACVVPEQYFNESLTLLQDYAEGHRRRLPGCHNG